MNDVHYLQTSTIKKKIIIVMYININGCHGYKCTTV